MALSDFRSYIQAEVEARSSLVVVTGPNGAGKTNLLEAMSLLSPGRGMRGAALAELARDGGPGTWAVAAEVAPGGPGPGAPVSFGTGTEAGDADRRQLRINGEPAPIGTLAEWLSVIWLTPAMDRVFIEGVSGRRRFLDRLTLATAPGHARNASRYEQAMRARNRLLAEPGRADPEWLSAIEQQMAGHGVALAAARLGAVGGLSERLGELSGEPTVRATLGIDGWLEAALGQVSEDEAARAFAQELRRRRDRDAASGRTSIGPHRSDFIVVHAEKNCPAARCSTGEQKALLLTLVLAQAELAAERRPLLLLLDEVAAHLDAGRRAALFARLALLSGQTWVTGTETELFAPVPDGATRIAVREGRLHIEQG